jgi:hypothetical protein
MRQSRRFILISGSKFGSADYTWSGGTAPTWIDDGSGNWRLKFTASGTFTPLKNVIVDAFLTGAGASGAKGNSTLLNRMGGNGGYTTTTAATSLTKDTAYSIVIGAGGLGASANIDISIAGGNTTAFGLSANGGAGRNSASSTGGSGGAGHNGTNGSNGSNGTGTFNGLGQGTTTKEFGESSGTLYSTGGAAGNSTSGAANTGNGGGGGSNTNYTAGDGGSGIVIIRNKR